MPAKRFEVAQANDLQNGEMKEVAVDGIKILLAKVDGIFYATSGECPHYGAALAEGVLCGDRVVCPWHKAVFRVTTGELLEPPALDPLLHYEVTVENERVFVHMPTAEVSQSVVPKAYQKNPCFVIAGAGAASTAAALRLRGSGFDGRLVVLNLEQHPPYDRTKLSKEFLSGDAGEDALPVRPPDFWSRHEVEHIAERLSEVKVNEHQISLANGSSLAYDRLLIATGSKPQELDVPGHDLGNVFTLRSQADALQIAQAAPEGVRTVIVGGSFIGMEVASCFALRKLPVTVVVSESTAFAKQLGPEVGRILQQWHEKNGVVFRLNAEVASLQGKGIVRNVVLQSGEEIPADLVVVGAGVQPSTDFVSDLNKEKDGGISVDANLQAAQDVYVGGDIAFYNETHSGTTTRIEHWRIALQHGRVAADNMLGRDEQFAGVPYFWTNHFGVRFDYVGHASDWDEVIMKEQDELPKFLAFYVKGGQIVAAAACQYDREIAALHELMRMGRVPTPEQIRKGLDLVAKCKDG